MKFIVLTILSVLMSTSAFASNSEKMGELVIGVEDLLSNADQAVTTTLSGAGYKVSNATIEGHFIQSIERKSELRTVEVNVVTNIMSRTEEETTVECKVTLTGKIFLFAQKVTCSGL